MIRLETNETPWRVIPLKFCTVSFYDYWVWTQFPDGSGYGGHPQYKPHANFYPNFTDDYREAALSVGYTSPMEYCREHDFFHSLISERVLDEPSQILWGLAHEDKEPPRYTVHEEAITLLFQSFYRGRPIFATSPDVDWFAIREDARRMLR